MFEAMSVVLYVIMQDGMKYPIRADGLIPNGMCDLFMIGIEIAGKTIPCNEFDFCPVEVNGVEYLQHHRMPILLKCEDEDGQTYKHPGIPVPGHIVELLKIDEELRHEDEAGYGSLPKTRMIGKDPYP